MVLGTFALSRTDSLPPLEYDNNFLLHFDTFQYLGKFFDNLNLHSATELQLKEALKPCLAGMARIRDFAHQHQLTLSSCITYGFLRRMSSWQAYMPVRFGQRPVFNKVTRWTTAFKNGY
eukprot:215701-Pelagomonas_calceolata.AAC.2